MTETRWEAILTSLHEAAPVNLDREAEGITPSPPAAWPEARAGRSGRSARIFWPDPEPAIAAIGVRVRRPLEDPIAAALHLAAAAAEREIEIVILSGVAQTGLERFGFRIERLPGDGAQGDPDEDALCEAELAAFWNLAIIIEADDLPALG